MTRDQAIDIARRRALNSREGHGYLPVTEADAATWMPHEWVIDAILWAAGFQTSIPLAAAVRVAQAALCDQPREDIDINDAHTLALFVMALGDQAPSQRGWMGDRGTAGPFGPAD